MSAAGVRPHNRVKFKAGKHHGMVGIVEAVAGGVARVRVEGVKNGLPFLDVAAVAVERLEVVG